jgi:hypothetical protein
MTDMYQESANLECKQQREMPVVGRIGVAVDRSDGGDDGQLAQNVVTADIARMEDEVNTGEGVVHARPEQSVSIRYQSDGVRVRDAGHGLYISR